MPASPKSTALADPTIAALRRRIEIREDPVMTALAPRLRPAQVTVTLADGRRSTQSTDSHRGNSERPFAAGELRAKFREPADTVLTTESARAAEQAVDRCEEWRSVGELPVLLRDVDRR